MLNAEDVVARLGLVPLEGEGGMYRSTYNSIHTLDGVPTASLIYYFLHGKVFSHFHLLTRDEIWLYHGGAAMNLVELFPDGTWAVTRLGCNLERGEMPQHLVSAGVWQGACLDDGADWGLAGTMMAPAYTPGCYTHGQKELLLERWPDAAPWIHRLTGETFAF